MKFPMMTSTHKLNSTASTAKPKKPKPSARLPLVRHHLTTGKR